MRSIVSRKVAVLSGITIVGMIVVICLMRESTLMPSSRLDRVQKAYSPCDSKPKRYVSPIGEEMQMYRRIIGDIVAAYTNQQASLISEGVQRLPGEFFSLRGKDWDEAIRPINRAWFAGWCFDEQKRIFSTSTQLSNWFQTNLTFAKAYGSILVRSGIKDSLAAFDVWVLAGLQSCRNEFEKDGNSDYVEVTDRFIVEWIEQIESEQGFTREYVRWQNRELACLVVAGEISQAALRNNIRGYVRALQKRCGYTPKWLDEEFPMIEEVADE